MSEPPLQGIWFEYGGLVKSVMVSIGGPFTALASNPPVHAGDEDAIVTVGGLAAGLLVTWMVWVLERPAGALRAWFATVEQSMDRRFMS